MKIENKFIVINKKHLEEISQDKNLKPLVDKFMKGLNVISLILPNNKYWVVNQDEPYANEVIKLIGKGEDSKEIL